MKDNTVLLTNGLTLDVKDPNCLYCGKDMLFDTGKIYLVFPMDLLYDPKTTIEKIGNLAHSYCMTKKASYFKEQMMVAMELGTVKEVPARVHIEEDTDRPSVPCGTKRGAVSFTDGIEEADKCNIA